MDAVMQADLYANLALHRPGPHAQWLRDMATWRRLGRVAHKADRLLPVWRAHGDWLLLPRGLLPSVQERLPGLKVRDRRRLLPRIDFHWRGNLFGYQEGALARLREQGGGVLVAPPGSGKTEVGLAFAASTRQPTLWLVHSLDLVEQTVERARRLYGLDHGAVGAIHEGQHDRWGSHLTVCTIQTLAKFSDLAREAGMRHGCVIADEAHHLPATSFLRVLFRCPGRYRLALTATPDRTDGLGPVIAAVMGPPVEIPVSVLVRAGRLTLPDVRVVYTGFAGTPDDGWGAFQKARAADERRNRLVVRLAVAAARGGRRVLVVVELVEHAHRLARMVRLAGVRSSSVVGAVSPERRRLLLDALVAAPGRVLVATKLADEGLDLPQLDCVVLAAPGRSPLRLRQQVGRVMRVYKGKRSAIVYDMADLGSPSLKQQLRARVRTYRRFGDTDLQPRRWGRVA
jgi:superfamily II DNA or RNA helicase